MPARKPYKVDIDVVPYLSIMAIVLKLICLILIVMVMRIAINPDALKVIRYKEEYKPREEAAKHTTVQGGSERQISRQPIYMDCHPDYVEVQPDGKVIPTLELKERGGDFQTLLHRLETSTNEFAILIARPNSVPVYRYIRRQLAARNMMVGYDVLDSNVIIDWAVAISNMQVSVQKHVDEIERMTKGGMAPVAPSAPVAPPEK